MTTQKILVTGGAGYIGSHACVALLEAGYDIVVVDNLSNSSIESLARVKQITGKMPIFVQADIRDKKALTDIFSEHTIYAVMHFAGLKAVGESCVQPIRYYQNNVYGTLVLTEVMQEFSVKKMIFSSSATVYGEPDTVKYSEELPVFGATNPYGKSKAMIEDILRDLSTADGLTKASQPWEIILLRYFNPMGAHESGLIGENPNGIPNNLVPYVSQVAVGKLAQLSVFGGDYPTVDGTGVRDYIHVIDLVKGHLAALKALDDSSLNIGCKAYNLGAGKGYSVLQIIAAFEQVTGKNINYKIVDRRTGDVAENYADPSLALRELNWKTEKNLEDMVEDTWRWQSQNPNGYN
ncbi:UDP-glucose 4-epimerase GalE [methanotrophic endosymbiont of Bathymodiolus puteoserpentis (Logatchev)]|uniref:UDP-glucose 4-epimerase GalE n=1 Tax=methanotrophic endosymbiont of Bathymodiolus puteoserpentis (Logatchev) TaxID=343235 RepID=UPI0013C61539|nr:UDP-glucose 4-epimerase GalE [methanotrophic endosymbiont of Bathymodiolus puteoserpentis (Logatchev)]SHE19288.1 UDP-glucose 4-epimerase [methanotrophic endosymbiont of Bathymodiolus puteoserpentis (Logatchev)]